MLLTILLLASLSGCQSTPDPSDGFEAGDVVREILGEIVEDDREIRINEVTSLENPGEWQDEAGCLSYSLDVQVLGSTRRTVQIRKTTWVEDEEGRLSPNYEAEIRNERIRQFPLELWDHPVEVAFQVSPGDGARWLAEDDPQNLLTREPEQSLRSATRRLYLCQSERQVLLRYPASSYQVTVRARFADGTGGEQIIDLRTRIPREVVAGR